MMYTHMSCTYATELRTALHVVSGEQSINVDAYDNNTYYLALTWQYIRVYMYMCVYSRPNYYCTVFTHVIFRPPPRMYVNCMFASTPRPGGSPQPPPSPPPPRQKNLGRNAHT